LSSPTNAYFARPDFQTAIGSILDDEPVISTVELVSGAEGNAGVTPFTFTVMLSAPYDAPVSVQYATADITATANSDYQATSGTLTFAPGETSRTYTVLVYGDRVAEPEEYIATTLSNPTSAHIGEGSGALGQILNDDASASVSDVSTVEGHSGTKTLGFTVML